MQVFINVVVGFKCPTKYLSEGNKAISVASFGDTLAHN
jgi:hypothetical protein